MTAAEVLEAWRKVAREQDAPALRAWTLEHVDALASALEVEPDQLRRGLNWTADFFLAANVEAVAVTSLVRLEMKGSGS